MTTLFVPEFLAEFPNTHVPNVLRIKFLVTDKSNLKYTFRNA